MFSLSYSLAFLMILALFSKTFHYVLACSGLWITLSSYQIHFMLVEIHTPGRLFQELCNRFYLVFSTYHPPMPLLYFLIFYIKYFDHILQYENRKWERSHTTDKYSGNKTIFPLFFFNWIYIYSVEIYLYKLSRDMFLETLR